MQGDDQVWGLTEQLLAAAVDALNGANWQRGGGKQRDKPKPIPRPGVGNEDKKSFGKGAVSMEAMDDFLGWSKELADPEPVRPVDKVSKPPRKRDARGRFTK
jgi:hypothetical protein